MKRQFTYIQKFIGDEFNAIKYIQDDKYYGTSIKETLEMILKNKSYFKISIK